MQALKILEACIGATGMDQPLILDMRLLHSFQEAFQWLTRNLKRKIYGQLQLSEGCLELSIKEKQYV